MIPDVFPAYARLFHPVEEDGVRRTWAEIAAENGRVPHPEMQLHEISRPAGEPMPEEYRLDHRVRWGSLPRRELEVLSGLLSRHTSTPDHCWCGVWEGYGQLYGGELAVTTSGSQSDELAVSRSAPIVPDDVATAPRVSAQERAYYLLCGPVLELPDLFDFLRHQSPNIWWPDDQAWCVATEVDFAWTYVGGSSAAIDSVLADPRLEALPTQPRDLFICSCPS